MLQVAAAVCAVLLLVLIWFAAESGDDGDDGAEQSSNARAVTSLSLEFPEGWVTHELDDVDGTAGLLAAAAHEGTGTTFIARTLVGPLASDVDVTELAAQTVAAMSSSIQGFDLVDQEVGARAGAEAITIVYRQAVGETVFTTRMLVVPLDRQTLYLTARAAGDGLEKTAEDVDRLIDASIREVASGD